MQDKHTEQLLQKLSKNPDYKILKRISEQFANLTHQDTDVFTATIIDLETMGMDARNHEIIELGLLCFSFTNGDGIVEVTDT